MDQTTADCEQMLQDAIIRATALGVDARWVSIEHPEGDLNGVRIGDQAVHVGQPDQDTSQGGGLEPDPVFAFGASFWRYDAGALSHEDFVDGTQEQVRREVLRWVETMAAPRCECGRVVDEPGRQCRGCLVNDSDLL